MRSDHDLRPRARTDVMGGGQVIGMRMRFQHIVERRALLIDDGEQPVRDGRGNGRCLGLEIQHRIDDRRARAGLVDHDIADRVGHRIEMGVDGDRHGGLLYQIFLI